MALGATQQNVDEIMLLIFDAAHDEIKKEFLNAVAENNIVKIGAIQSKIDGINIEVSAKFRQRAEYRMWYEYINGASQAEIKRVQKQRQSFIKETEKMRVDEWIAATQDYIRVNLWAPHIEAVEQLVTNSLANVNEALAWVKRQAWWKLAEIVRVKVQQNLALDELVGASRQKTIQNIIDAIKEKWVWSFRDSAGKTRSLPRYAQMIVRTETATAYNIWTYNRWVENWYKKFIRREMYDACPICAPYNGKVYKMDDPDAQIWPIHPNCRWYIELVV